MHIDDLVESMSLAKAHAMLLEVLDLLYGRISDEAKVELSDGDNDAILAAQIRHIFGCFRRHLLALLPETVYAEGCEGAIYVYQAMAMEETFRKARSNDLNEYLIRAHTISLAPLFTLLRFAIDPDLPASSQLRQLEQHIYLAVGMQNDILGLDRDIAEGEWMSYPIVYAASKGLEGHPYAITEGATEGAVIHNRATDIAVRTCQDLVVQGQESELAMAVSLLELVSRHFKWAHESKRYAAEE